MLAIESILDKEKIEEIMCVEGDGSMQAAADKRLVSITRQVRPSFVFCCCFLFFFYLTRPLRLIQFCFSSCAPRFAQEVQTSNVISCHLDSWICA